MDVVMLSRLQFAVATLFHFIFVPLTLGLSILIAIMETMYVRTGNEEYKAMAKFWGKIFLINFVVGVVTGITLEFQFGTNWAGYSKYVGDIFGSLLAIEATVAFFLESTFVAVWAFGWKRLSPKFHAACIWLVAIASNMSAYWILVANSWMQHPVGYTIRNGRAELTDFWAIVTQPFAIITYLHTTFAGYIVAGFFVMGVSAYHLLRKNQVSFFTKSFRIALVFAFIFSVLEVGVGDLHGREMAHAQPEKVAAVEAQWETQKGAPFALLLIPDESNERNIVEMFKIPKFLSKLVYGDWDAEFKGLKSWPPQDRPPVTLVFGSFRIMVGLGFLFILLTVIGIVRRNRLESSKTYLKVMLYAIPLPYIAGLLGWIVTEVGRQPWLVYHVMRTSEGHSPVDASQVGISLLAFIILYSLLGLAAFALMVKHAKQGPEHA
ncbi:MAG: cytochrome bd ubiquinol oxidase subunit [Thermodesulfobacteriota bacterium]|nr:cytochrome bd ubiquinol oxidase subunit [Thermodesulfobacteriota bacterium]